MLCALTPGPSGHLQHTLLGVKARKSIQAEGEALSSAVVLSRWAGRTQHNFSRSSVSCTDNLILTINHPTMGWYHPMVLMRFLIWWDTVGVQEHTPSPPHLPRARR